MAKVSEKSPEMAKTLEEMFGRTHSIESNQCIPPPYGCGGDATEFRCDLSAKEYTISGLCQKCQDSVFGK